MVIGGLASWMVFPEQAGFRQDPALCGWDAAVGESLVERLPSWADTTC